MYVLGLPGIKLHYLGLWLCCRWCATQKFAPVPYVCVPSVFMLQCAAVLRCYMTPGVAHLYMVMQRSVPAHTCMHAFVPT